MFEKFLSANARDFSTRYQGTYGFYRGEDKPPMLVRLQFVEDRVVFIDRRSAEYTLYADTQKDIGFEFLPPKSGFFNTDLGALYVERVAARQFTRGVCSRNTKIYLMKPSGWQNLEVNFTNLALIYESKIDGASAFKKLVEKAVPSFALTSQFAMDNSKVFLFGTAVGDILQLSTGLVKIKLYDPNLFRTEIRDAFRGITQVEFVQ